MDGILAVAVGTALAAATGFRVFVPLLVLSLGARTGALPVTLSPEWAWIGTGWATAAFAVATLLEVGAYWLPWVDNALDAVATPASVLAGTLLTVAVAGDLPPLLRWSAAVVAGGGAAALVQGSTVALRGISSLATGGAGNPVLSTAEAAGSAALSLLAVLVPLLAVLLLGAAAVAIGAWLRRRRRGYRGVACGGRTSMGGGAFGATSSRASTSRWTAVT